MLLVPTLALLGALAHAGTAPTPMPDTALTPSAASATAAAPAPDDWRARIRAFADSNLQHSAWGTAHARRDYETARALARAEGVTVDDDALYAAAYLHDMGAFPAYAAAGVDHGERAAALVDAVLRDAGFPMAKAPLVRDIVARHMYYHAPGASPEARLFRDADTLDFLGAVGVARIVSLTTRHRWAPDLPAAIETVRRHTHELPAKLESAAARADGARRVATMQAWLDALAGELGDATP